MNWYGSTCDVINELVIPDDVQDVVHGVPRVEVVGCRRGRVCYLSS